MTEMSRQESDMQKVVSQSHMLSNVGVQMMRRSNQIKWCQSRRQIGILFLSLEKKHIFSSIFSKTCLTWKLVAFISFIALFYFDSYIVEKIASFRIFTR